MSILKTLVVDGMSNVTSKDLNGFPLSMLNSVGGIVGANDFLVAPIGTPNNTVTVAAGRAWIPAVDGTNMTGVYQDSTSAPITIASNSSGNTRWDYIVLYLNTAATPTATGTNVPQLIDVQGTPSGSPVVPTVAQIQTAIGSASYPYLILAKVVCINNFTTIGSGQITDLRTFTYVPIGTVQTITGSNFPSSTTLTGKTLVKPTFNASVQNVATYTPSAGGTATLDCSTANIHKITMPAGNITIATSNVSTGQSFLVSIQQDGTGSRTVTWFSSIKWVAATAPTLTTTASRWDIFAFFFDGTNYYGSIVGLNFG